MENFSLLLSTLFWSADQTHLWHFQCGKKNLHTLLNEYYDEVREDLDDIMEVWMGVTGNLPEAKKPLVLVDYKDISQVKEHFDTVCKMLTKVSDSVTERHLQAPIDDLREDIARFKYLLSLLDSKVVTPKPVKEPVKETEDDEPSVALTSMKDKIKEFLAK